MLGGAKSISVGQLWLLQRECCRYWKRPYFLNSFRGAKSIFHFEKGFWFVAPCFGIAAIWDLFIHTISTIVFFLFDQISHHWIFIFFHFLFSIWWGHHTSSSMYISAPSPSCHIGTTLALIFWALVVHESVDIIGGSCSPFYSVCCFSFESNRTSFE